MQRTQHLLRSSILVILIFGVNKVTGFGKLLLMTQTFGTSPQADAFAAANQLPELFYALLSGGALAAALIPVYSAYLTEHKRSEATGLANTVLTLTLLILGLICAVAALFAPWLTQVVLVPDFSVEQQLLTAGLMRISLLSTVFFALASVISSLLNAHQHFAAPAWGTVAMDVGQIIGLYFLAPRWGIHGVAWGSFIGVMLILAVQTPAIIHYRLSFRPQIALRLAGVRELVRLMGPRIVTLGAYQAVDLIFIRLASQLPDGRISAYFYALLLMISMPGELFGRAINMVIFPTLAEQYNTGDNHELKRTTVQALRALWTLIIPAAIGFVALGEPAVAFLLQRGSFDAESTSLVYGLLVILALRLVSETSQGILSLPLFARHNTRLPMWATLGWMITNVSLSFLLVGPYGIRGLTWATTLAALTQVALLYTFNRRVIGSLDEPMLGRTLRQILLACLGMSAAVSLLRGLGLEPLPYLVIAIPTGISVYGGLYLLLGGREVLSLWRVLKEQAAA